MLGCGLGDLEGAPAMRPVVSVWACWYLGIPCLRKGLCGGQAARGNEWRSHASLNCYRSKTLGQLPLAQRWAVVTVA
jgi:hypothetical protein